MPTGSNWQAPYRRELQQLDRPFADADAVLDQKIDELVPIDERDGCVFRAHLGTDSGRTWAPVPAHLGTDSGHLGTDSGTPGHGIRSTWAGLA